MFGWIRSRFADPFTGDALVVNSEFVVLPHPSEEPMESTASPMQMFPRVTRRVVRRAQGIGALEAHHRRVRRRELRSTLGSITFVLGLLLVCLGSGSEDLPTLLGVPAVGLVLLFVGTALWKR